MTKSEELERRRAALLGIGKRLVDSCVRTGDWAGALVWRAHMAWIDSDEWVIAQRSGGIV